mgnify:CR=1 FL=1
MTVQGVIDDALFTQWVGKYVRAYHNDFPHTGCVARVVALGQAGEWPRVFWLVFPEWSGHFGWPATLLALPSDPNDLSSQEELSLEYATKRQAFIDRGRRPDE